MVEVPTALLREAVERGRSVRLVGRMLGQSMFPIVPAGATVDIELRRLPLQRGDIVVLELREQLVVHRVVDVDETTGWITTQGDANPVPDRPRVADEILGRVERIRYPGGLTLDPRSRGMRWATRLLWPGIRLAARARPIARKARPIVRRALRAARQLGGRMPRRRSDGLV